MDSEEYCKYVCSMGILKSCDIIITEITDYKINIEKYDFTGLKDGMIIYVNSNIILYFSKIINDIPYRFVLVSGNSDESIHSEMFTNYYDFLNNDKIIHWFSQNCLDITHPKLSQIPIGLDYHTLTHTKCHIGDITSSLNQELELENVLTNSQPFWERKKKIFSNFHYSMAFKVFYTIPNDPTQKIYEKEIHNEERYRAINMISRELIDYQPSIMHRKDSWKELINYTFLISPPGNGLDCHRTWEGLCLGSIVIIKSSLLDPLYDDLPVLIVKDWSDITKELLEITIIEYRYRKFNYEKLTLKYWIDKIREKSAEM